MADNDGADEWIADAPNSGVEKISVKDNPLGSRDVDALIPTKAAKAASVPLSDFMELSSTVMERFFQPEVIWGSIHSHFNAPVQQYAKQNHFEVGFDGNMRTIKYAFCRAPLCPWRLQWNYSKRLNPPSWVVQKYSGQHSEACLADSLTSQVYPLPKKKPIVRAMCTDDIVRLIGPDVRAIGEPSCLQPIQIHHLVAPFIPPEKHSNHDYIRNLRKIVLDGCKGIFNQRL